MECKTEAASSMKRMVGNYELGETLGKGGYSWVKKGTDAASGKQYALKFMTRADASWETEQAEQVRTEIKSMIHISSEHVMKLHAYNLNAKYPSKNGKELKTILLVLELCPGGELFDILYYCNQLPEIVARTYFQQLIQGLSDCHKAGVVHRDIKPQNLLMDRDYQLKITDFGLSYLMKDPSRNQQELMSTSYVGTRGYQAPELLSRKQYTKACDIFSAGVVLFILLTGYPPFDQAAKTDKWFRPLYKGDTATFWQQHRGCGVPESCKELIVNMLAYKPTKRYTIEDVRAHPWFNGETYGKAELRKAVKTMHEEARAKRLKDKKKQADMQDSVKEHKKREAEEFDSIVKARRTAWGDEPPAGEVPHLHTFALPEGTDAVAAFHEIYDIFKLNKVWENAQITDLDNAKPFAFQIAMTDKKGRKFAIQASAVRTGEGRNLVAITRRQGNPLDWNRIYRVAESTIIDHLYPSDSIAPPSSTAAKPSAADSVPPESAAAAPAPISA